MVQYRLMHKAKAIELLGGSVAEAARRLGVSYQAINKWPEELPPRIADRVVAAVARDHLPADVLKQLDAACSEAGAEGAPEIDHPEAA